MERVQLLDQLYVQRAAHFKLISKWEYNFHQSLRSYSRFSLKQCKIAIKIYKKLLDADNKAHHCLNMNIADTKRLASYKPFFNVELNEEQQRSVNRMTPGVLEIIEALQELKGRLEKNND